MKEYKMLKKLNISMLVLLFAIFANVSSAEEGLEFDINSGRGGEPKRVEDPTEFKVCADPANLPYSNKEQEGFENKIAELIAKDLGKKLSYQFWYDRMGFMRNTINAYRCDVMMSMTSDNDGLLTSKPYYRSGHVFVYRKDSGYNIKDWNSPDLRKGTIGIIQESPATRPLADHGLMENSRPYRMQRDLNLPSSYLIDDLVKGDVDVAIIWGPIGGYFAKKASIPLEVVMIPEYEQTNAKGKEYWNISVAVRKKDKERMAMIQEVLDRRQADILKILDDYGIPHVPVVAGDGIEKVFKKSKETRGDAIPKME
jgi:mxaJ protein